DEHQVVERRAAQFGHGLAASLDRPALLEEKLAAEESRRLTRVRVVSPEAMHEPLLAEYHVRLALLLREFGEGAERALGARLYEGRVADERHAREAARGVAARVEGSAVERTLKPGVADQSRHDYCVDGALGE